MANSNKNISISSVSIVLLLLILTPFLGWSTGILSLNTNANTSFLLVQKKQNQKHQEEVINKYLNRIKDKKGDSLAVFQKLAFTYAEIDEPELAAKYIERYVKSSLDINFVGHSFFDTINDSEAYQVLADRYLKSVNLWSIFCLYTGLIGFFVAIVINLRKRSDKVANLLMSLFVFLHSFFIVHVCTLLTNYHYYAPHTLYVSTCFSFLYGPLIYFYFKRVILNYKFRVIDLVHVLPTIWLVLFILLPVYVQSAEQKMDMMLNGTTPNGNLITGVKLVSLIFYGILIVRIYASSREKRKSIPKIQFVWQRNIVIFCLLYIGTYSIYASLIFSGTLSGILFNLQVGLMASLVLYVSYTAFVQPSIFGNLKVIKTSKEVNKFLPATKYVKSGLTESLSMELKGKLLNLLNDQKVYKQNDITLQKLSELMDTTRHNTSQIINEHFNLNFFELINKYRIEEAKELLKEERHKNFNIIDIAYEVGFNNKVTFNKSFKKYNQITPSEYLKSLVA